VALAVVLAAAALAVAVIGLVREPAQPATSSSNTSTANTNTEAADRSLCQAIAPMMKEAIDTKRAFVDLGHTGAPQRDQGIPQFQAATGDWVDRAQKVLDQHANPPRYLTRMLQRYIDDSREYAASIRPGPESDGDAAAWNDSLVALGGPMEMCPTFGVRWW
jgi:thioesterase domain-containing protein